MGCISSKVLTRSGSLQEKANHRFQRSSLTEEIILSNSKSNGDQFLALLRTSSSASAAARRSKDAAAAEQSPAAAKIETIDVSELLAGLDEENTEEEDEKEERQDGRRDRGKASPRCASDGAAAGRAMSFRTVEEFDALVTRSGSPEKAKPATLAREQDPSVVPPPQSSSSEQEETTMVAAASNQHATATATGSSSSGQRKAGGAKRRTRARQLGELSAPAPPAFDFSKSGSLRDWLLGGGQIFSPDSYVTPKFGNVAAPPESEHGGRLAGERHQQQQYAVFDPELVAQFEQAMEELSLDEERVLKEVLVILEAGEKGETEMLARPDDQPPVVVQD